MKNTSTLIYTTCMWLNDVRSNCNVPCVVDIRSTYTQVYASWQYKYNTYGFLQVRRGRTGRVWGPLFPVSLFCSSSRKTTTVWRSMKSNMNEVEKRGGGRIIWCYYFTKNVASDWEYLHQVSEFYS